MKNAHHQIRAEFAVDFSNSLQLYKGVAHEKEKIAR